MHERDGGTHQPVCESQEPIQDFYAIIPAGGAGTRLWPLSRARSPKFLADLTSCGQSMLQSTVQRLKPLAEDRVLVVTGEAHLDAVQSQLTHLPSTQFIAEPCGRDSMAAIGLAAAVLQERHGSIVAGSFAADHMIAREDVFIAAVKSAIVAARDGKIATVGIEPEYAATGFGYIHLAKRCSYQSPLTVYDVSEFMEKPNQDRSREFVASGQYMWNAGMFVFRTDVLLAALQAFEPQLYEGILSIARAWDTPQRSSVMDDLWVNLKKIAIDHAIAEPLAQRGGVAVVPASMGWSDVGDYRSLGEVLAEKKSACDSSTYCDAEAIVSESSGSNDKDGDAVVQIAPGGSVQPVVTDDANGTIVYTHSKPVVIVGVPDAIVVETADVIFVTLKEQSQRVKDVVGKLPEELR
ncbi:mannose-1-phosphate guanylyltransferase [Arcanobacterium bovis]|uniref:Mannose-1-phosphate guanylyltransferase n=2 Tax=Arcanobacterium bovis TaxID=2529275 RepID=A0A4Q9V0T3_9ACTO|nr:mannose-1-phosphate guanylyltransferase [Arcanobacterium bovis]